MEHFLRGCRQHLVARRKSPETSRKTSTNFLRSLCVKVTIYLNGNSLMYSARAQDDPQVMERNQAAARHSWARQHAWLLLFSLRFLWAILSTSTVGV